jgi:hypothetical protein
LFERKHEQLAPRAVFLRRLAVTFSIGLLLVSFSLFIGTAGYRYTLHLPWLDSFLNASMILSGMGPLDRPETDSAKWFAGLYALYSGLVVILTAGISFAPVIHRMFHLFHLEETDDDQ